MSTMNRRITVTLSPELEKNMELLKKIFYRENESVLARILMEHGLDALYGSHREIGGHVRTGLSFAGKHGRIYTKEERSPLSLVGEYMFPNVTIKVIDISETRTETITYATVIRETVTGVEEMEGILTADGILYLYVSDRFEIYPLGGKYIRNRRPVEHKGQTYIPILLKRSIMVEEEESASVIEGFSDGGDVEFYFCVDDGELYRFDRERNRLVCQRAFFEG